MKKPDKISLAMLPTPIMDFSKFLPENAQCSIYIKRDDFTGMEMSGNKVRKLEYSLCEALGGNADVFITCGGVQSNHARATAAAAASLNKKSHLVLRGSEEDPEGNHFLDMLFGAEITYVTQEEYKNDRADIMEKIKADYAQKGLKAYILPEGASNGIGLFGYYNAYEEILNQEKELGITFDTIVLTEGSGGTYAGLYAANEIYGLGKNIVAFNIYNKDADVRREIEGIVEEARLIGGHKEPISYDNVTVINDYAGEGYGITSEEAMHFIRELSMKTGIAFDPVYTGKTLYGLYCEIEKGNELFKGNVLFIHTGGLFGIFPKRHQYKIK